LKIEIRGGLGSQDGEKGKRYAVCQPPRIAGKGFYTGFKPCKTQKTSLQGLFFLPDVR
jgi:hypothetical protein